MPTVPFSLVENFDDGVLNAEPWLFLNNVIETSGHLLMTMSATDQRSRATLGFEDGLSTATISYDAYMHAANNYFHGENALRFATEDGDDFTIRFYTLRSSYGPDYGNDPANYDLPRIAVLGPDGSITNLFSTGSNTSSFLNDWTRITIDFDSELGSVSIDMESDGVPDLEFSADFMVDATLDEYLFGTYGWFTGHYTRIDNVEVVGSFETESDQPQGEATRFGNLVFLTPGEEYTLSELFDYEGLSVDGFNLNDRTVGGAYITRNGEVIEPRNAQLGISESEVREEFRVFAGSDAALSEIVMDFGTDGTDKRKAIVITTDEFPDIARSFQDPVGDGSNVYTPNAGTNGFKIDQVFDEYNSGFRSQHLGVDWNGVVNGEAGNADIGMDVMAVGNGIVIEVGRVSADNFHSTAFGNYVVVAHIIEPQAVEDEGIVEVVFSLYAHLNSVDEEVSVGETIGIGEKIGEIGNSGDTWDPVNEIWVAHLHFEMTTGGTLPTSQDGYESSVPSNWIDPNAFIDANWGYELQALGEYTVESFNSIIEVSGDRDRFKFFADNAHEYQIVVEGVGPDALQDSFFSIRRYDQDTGLHNVVFGSPDGDEEDQSGIRESHTWSPETPGEYFIVVGGGGPNYASETGDYTITITALDMGGELVAAGEAAETHVLDDELRSVVFGTVESLFTDSIIGFFENDEIVLSNILVLEEMFDWRLGSAVLEFDVNTDGVVDGTITLEGDYFEHAEFNLEHIGNNTRITVDLPPMIVAGDDFVFLEEDSFIVGDVSENDSHEEGVDLSFSLVEGPANGTLKFFDDGAFIYEANSDRFDHATLGEVVTEAFEYEVSDGLGGSNRAIVTIEVQIIDDGVTMIGESGPDHLIGTDGGEDLLHGGLGDDVILGLGGVDSLLGGAGADSLDGGWGADLLNGGADNDILAGGVGADHFFFDASAGTDTIIDFEIGIDKIHVGTDNDASSFDELAVSMLDGNVVFDLTGGQIIIQDAGIGELTAFDFIFE